MDMLHNVASECNLIHHHYLPKSGQPLSSLRRLDIVWEHGGWNLCCWHLTDVGCSVLLRARNAWAFHDMKISRTEGNRVRHSYPQSAEINQASIFSQRPLNQRTRLNEGLRQQRVFTLQNLLVKNENVDKLWEWQNARLIWHAYRDRLNEQKQIVLFSMRVEGKRETCHPKHQVIGSYAVKSCKPDDFSLAVPSTFMKRMTSIAIRQPRNTQPDRAYVRTL